MEWWKNRAVYQIYPRSFLDTTGNGMGDLRGVTAKLDYLERLGVGAIWLCPVFESPQKDNGYDVSDYRRIDPAYGTNEDMQELIREAHARNIKVILDLVVNHTSNQHPWFQMSRDKNSPYRDFYYWRPGKAGGEPSNWGGEFTESAWTYDEQSGEYYFHTFSPEQPDLNWNNPQVIKEVMKIMRFWQDQGVDGWLIDAIPYIDKRPDFKDYDPKDFPEGQTHFMGDYHYKNGRLYDFIRLLNDNVWSKYPECMRVAELGGEFTVKDILRYTADGTAFTMCFTFDHMGFDADPHSKNGKWSKKEFDFKGFKKNFAYWQQLNRAGGNVALYMNNHDQPRAVSRFVDCTGYRGEYAKTLAIMLHLMGGTPYIYQGEEIGMTNCPFEKDEYRDLEFVNAYHDFVETGRMSEEEFLRMTAYRGRDNSRTPMQWNAEENAGFTEGTPWIKVNPNYEDINVESQLDDPGSVFSCYRRLLALRRDYPVIQSGAFRLLRERDPACFTYLRKLGGQTLYVACNFTGKPVTRTLPLSLVGERGKMLVSSYADSAVPKFRFTLRPFESFGVLFFRPGEQEGGAE